MSVRRLADDAVQPVTFAYSADNAGWAVRTIGKYPEGRQQSAVIPLLMRAQEQDGWVTRAAIEHVAEMLQMPLIRVLEVATFYTQFQLHPVGVRAHVQVCGTTPCMLRGSDDLKAVCREKIHPEQFHPNEAGTLSWEEVECLGACVNAPMVMIFKDTYEDLTPERLGEIIELFDSGRADEVRPGPQNGRHLSAPIGGLTTLQDEPDARSDGRQENVHRSDSSGSGAAAQTPPSEAGRPNTYSPTTDPTIEAPGKADEGNEDAEAAASVDPSAGADRPGAGDTGGTAQGPTGAEEKEEEADEDSARASTAIDGTPGLLRRQERMAESQVVPDLARGKDTDPSPPPPRGTVADLTGIADGSSAPPEAQRKTSDITAGPAASDQFEDRGDEQRERLEDEVVQGSLETRQRRPIGREPAGLLSEPAGQKDDLKRIRGIGPVIEDKLNELGVFHIRQVAAWDIDNLMWIDDRLNFRGRALRDKWIERARELEAGSPAGDEA